MAVTLGDILKIVAAIILPPLGVFLVRNSACICLISSVLMFWCS